MNIERNAMTLEREDFVQIEKMFERFGSNTQKQIRSSEKSVKKDLRQDVKESEQRVITRISREISYLAEINRAVIEKVSIIDDYESRVRRLEIKAGIR